MTNPGPPEASPDSKPDPLAPVVWTPEDAAHFLSTAIKEAQQPFAQALLRQGVPRATFALTVFLLVLLLGCGGVGVYYFLRENSAQHTRQMQQVASGPREHLRSLQDEARYNREQAEVFRKAFLAAQKETLEQRLQVAQSDRIRQESEDLRKKFLVQSKENAGLQRELRKAVDKDTGRLQELAGLRNQMRLVQTQMEGLQEEKDALAKQLDASRRMLRMLQGGSRFQEQVLPEEEPAAEPAPPLTPEPEPAEEAPSTSVPAEPHPEVTTEEAQALPPSDSVSPAAPERKESAPPSKTLPSTGPLQRDPIGI